MIKNIKSEITVHLLPLQRKSVIFETQDKDLGSELLFKESRSEDGEVEKVQQPGLHIPVGILLWRRPLLLPTGLNMKQPVPPSSCDGLCTTAWFRTSAEGSESTERVQMSGPESWQGEQGFESLSILKPGQGLSYEVVDHIRRVLKPRSGSWFCQEA